MLGSLVEHSLVIAEQRGAGSNGPPAADEQGSLRGRHRDFFLELAEQAAPHLETARQRKWLERLDPEAANLAAATDSV